MTPTIKEAFFRDGSSMAVARTHLHNLGDQEAGAEGACLHRLAWARAFSFVLVGCTRRGSYLMRIKPPPEVKPQIVLAKAF